jgi:hypothetical protein
MRKHMIDARACRVRIAIFDDDKAFGHLITYDADFNDPPPDLVTDADSFLRKNSHRYAVSYNDAIGIDVHCRSWADAREFVERFADREANATLGEHRTFNPAPSGSNPPRSST